MPNSTMPDVDQPDDGGSTSPDRQAKVKSKQDIYAQWMAGGLVTLAVVMAITLLPRDWVGVVFGVAVFLLVGGWLAIKGEENWPRLQQEIQRGTAYFKKKRAWIGAATGALTAGLMVLAGHRLGVGASDARLNAGLAIAVVGLGVAGIAALTLPQRAISAPTTLVGRTNWIVFGAGILLLWLVSEANGQLLKWKAVAHLPSDNQFIYLCGGIGLVILGLGGVRWLKNVRLNRSLAWEGVAIGVVMLLGLGIRVWELENAVHKFVDELNFGSIVLYFEENEPIALLYPMVHGFPAIYPYWQHWGMDLFGRDLAALRIVSVVLGTLTLPAVYLLGRETFDKRTGFIAATLLAVFPPHIQFSRLGLNNIAEPLFGTLAFALMARAIKTQKRLDYALSGACLGLTQYFYEGGRLLYPPLMLVWVVMGAVVWRPKPSGRGLMIAVLALLAVGGPIYYTLLSTDAPLTPRMDDVGRVTDKARTVDQETNFDLHMKRLKNAFRVYTNLPEGPWIYYGTDRALLLSAIIPFFLMGAAYTIWRVRSPAFLLVIWVVSTSVGNSFLSEPAVSARYVVVFPALALLIAVGIHQTAQLIWPKNLPAYGQGIAIAGLVIGLGIYQVDFFMGPQLAQFNQQIRILHYDGEDALFRARALPEGTHAYIVGEDYFDYGYAHGIMLYLQPSLKVELLAPQEVTWLYLEALPKQEDTVFFVMPDDTQTIDRLRRFYVLLPPQKSPYNVPEDQQFLMYFAPAYLQQRPNRPAMGIEPQP